jgi:4-amino-4-deoxy-L-arabinose transferase-like glycosyltransferase
MIEPGTFTDVRASARGIRTTLVSSNSARLLIGAALLVAAMLIGCSNLSGSGSLWPDGSQYANAAAMIHDWLLSGDIFHPWTFAERNYVQFPAFHLPYHPPGYPALLGLFFILTGVSYDSGRIFIALCLWVSGCFFYGILRRTGLSRTAAFCGALLLLTTPEIAFWSRDTMSEIPGLALILAASFFFLVWLATESTLACIAAFCLAEAAFLSRYLTAGVLPAWFLWALLAGKFRKLFSPALLTSAILYLILNAGWIIYTLPFSRYETVYSATPPNTNYGTTFSWKILAFYVTRIPSMIGWVTLLAAFIGLLYAIRSRQGRFRQFFWLSWLFSNVIFLLIVKIYQEDRYFIYALPSFIGLAAATFASTDDNPAGSRRYLGPILVGLCLLANANTLRHLPQGVVGYEIVGQRLARLDAPGNILVSSLQQADLIFRYRSNHPALKRSFIRGDRSLAIRPPHYSNAQTTSVAHNAGDVLDIVRRGRVRYLVTCSLNYRKNDNRAEEMKFLDEIMRSQPASFQLLGKFPVHFEYGNPGYSGNVWLWKFTGELPSGPSEIPVVIPTANLSIQPRS